MGVSMKDPVLERLAIIPIGRESAVGTWYCPRTRLRWSFLRMAAAADDSAREICLLPSYFSSLGWELADRSAGGG